MELLTIYFTVDNDDYEYIAYIEGTENTLPEGHAEKLLDNIKEYAKTMDFTLSAADRKNKFFEDLLTGKILNAHVGQFDNNEECIDYMFKDYPTSRTAVSHDRYKHMYDHINASFELADESKYPMDPAYDMYGYIVNYNTQADNADNVFKVTED